MQKNKAFSILNDKLMRENLYYNLKDKKLPLCSIQDETDWKMKLNGRYMLGGTNLFTLPMDIEHTRIRPQNEKIEDEEQDFYTLFKSFTESDIARLFNIRPIKKETLQYIEKKSLEIVLDSYMKIISNTIPLEFISEIILKYEGSKNSTTVKDFISNMFKYFKLENSIYSILDEPMMNLRDVYFHKTLDIIKINMTIGHLKKNYKKILESNNIFSALVKIDDNNYNMFNMLSYEFLNVMKAVDDKTPIEVLLYKYDKNSRKGYDIIIKALSKIASFLISGYNYIVEQYKNINTNASFENKLKFVKIIANLMANKCNVELIEHNMETNIINNNKIEAFIDALFIIASDMFWYLFISDVYFTYFANLADFGIFKNKEEMENYVINYMNKTVMGDYLMIENVIDVYNAVAYPNYNIIFLGMIKSALKASVMSFVRMSNIEYAGSPCFGAAASKLNNAWVLRKSNTDSGFLSITPNILASILKSVFNNIKERVNSMYALMSDSLYKDLAIDIYELSYKVSHDIDVENGIFIFIVETILKPAFKLLFDKHFQNVLEPT